MDDAGTIAGMQEAPEGALYGDFWMEFTENWTLGCDVGYNGSRCIFRMWAISDFTAKTIEHVFRWPDR